MKATRLDDELERISKKFPYLWGNNGFHVAYFTRDYGMYYGGFIIGMENDVCRLVFEKETNSPVESIAINVGKKQSLFAPPNYSYFAEDGWFSLTGLIYWLSGVECERDNNVDKDLEYVSQYTKLHLAKLLELFRDTDKFYEKLQYFRNLHKGNQITVDKIRQERARLHALGQDSSLEAAISSLRGGTK